MSVRLAIVSAFAGLALAIGVPAQGLAEDMAFRLVPVGDAARCGSKCVEVIAAEGEIVSGTPRAFVDFIKGNLGDKRVRSVVLFHSPGGSVGASMQLGMVLRNIGAATVVARARNGAGAQTSGFSAGRCYSACVYALMGGKRRIVPPESEVGIHRSFSIFVGADPGREYAASRVQIDNGSTGAAIGRYSDLMGISRDLINSAQKTLPDSIHILTRAEITRWRLGGAKF